MWIFICGVAGSKLGQKTQQDFNFDDNKNDFIAIFIPTETHTLDNVSANEWPVLTAKKTFQFSRLALFLARVTREESLSTCKTPIPLLNQRSDFQALPFLSCSTFWELCLSRMRVETSLQARETKDTTSASDNSGDSLDHPSKIEENVSDEESSANVLE